MTVAVTHALASGARAVICASTGNTSASAAAYAARAGLTSAVLVPQGKIAAGKLAQAVAYGARILQIEGNFDDCLELARKTAASTRGDRAGQLGEPGPDRGAEDRGLRDLRRAGPRAGRALPAGRQRRQHHRLLEGLPRVPRRRCGRRRRRGCSASRRPARHRWCSAARCSNPDTIATAIRIGAPASWAGAIDARDASDGLIDAVTDEQILAAYRLLATTEGVFVEPASAASVAGLLATAADGRLPRGSLVVCTVTGHGLKDPDTRA